VCVFVCVCVCLCCGGRGVVEGRMTGNLAICRTEIGSHLHRLSERKADFTADGLAVAGLETQGGSAPL
jgi:hypothetical protein